MSVDFKRLDKFLSFCRNRHSLKEQRNLSPKQKNNLLTYGRRTLCIKKRYDVFRTYCITGWCIWKLENRSDSFLVNSVLGFGTLKLQVSMELDEKDAENSQLKERVGDLQRRYDWCTWNCVLYYALTHLFPSTVTCYVFIFCCVLCSWHGKGPDGSQANEIFTNDFISLV